MRGRFELDFPDIPGRDLSGAVVGTARRNSRPEVRASGARPPTRWGSHAELVAVDAGVLLEKPASMPPLSPDIRRRPPSTAPSRKACKSSSMPPQAASAPSRSSTAYPAAPRSTPRRAPATRNSSGRWRRHGHRLRDRGFPRRGFGSRRRLRSAATFTCARRARSNPAGCWSASMPRQFPTAPGGRTFAFRRRRSRTNARE